jgi:GcrA cell cycle regulator
MSFWTDEHTAELKLRWANGETCSAISRAMGTITRNAVISKVHRLGLDGRIAISKKNANNTRNGIKARQRENNRNSRKMLHYFDGRLFVENHQGDEMLDDTPPDFKHAVRFIELRDHHCRWPGPGRAGPDLLCCGAPALDGYPYCAGHCRIAYQPHTPRLAKAPRL